MRSKRVIRVLLGLLITTSFDSYAGLWELLSCCCLSYEQPEREPLTAKDPQVVRPQAPPRMQDQRLNPSQQPQVYQALSGRALLQFYLQEEERKRHNNGQRIVPTTTATARSSGGGAKPNVALPPFKQ